MNKLFILVFIVLAKTAFAQTGAEQKEDFIGKIILSVNPASDDSKGLSPSQLSRLKTRTLSIATNNGVGGTEDASVFCLVPKLNIYDEQLAEGMKNITVLTMEYVLTINQVPNNIVFASYTIKLKGSGFTKNEAIDNAISKIDPNDPKAKEFIKQGKDKILSFYNSKCKDIIAEADKYAAVEDYERALAILLCIPIEATPCHEAIKNKAFSIFKLYQKKKCKSQIQLAQTQMAGKQFIPALTTLAFVDPGSTCAGEISGLMANIQSKMTEEEKRQWDMEKQRMKNAREIEEMKTMASLVSSFVSGFGSLVTLLGFL